MVVFACQMFYCCFINHISWSQQPEYQKLNKQKKKAEEIKLRNAWNKQSSLGCLVWSNGTILSHMLVEKKHDSLGYVCTCRHVITKYFDSTDKNQCCCWGGGARLNVCMCGYPDVCLSVFLSIYLHTTNLCSPFHSGTVRSVHFTPMFFHMEAADCYIVTGGVLKLFHRGCVHAFSTQLCA